MYELTERYKENKNSPQNEINSTFSSLPLSARRILFMVWRRLIHVKSYLREQPFVLRSGICIYRWYWCNRCLPAVKRGAEELQASVIRIPRNQLLTVRAIKALDIRRREVNYLLMQQAYEPDCVLWLCWKWRIYWYAFSHVIEPYITMLKDSYTTRFWSRL